MLECIANDTETMCGETAFKLGQSTLSMRTCALAYLNE